MGFVAGLQDIKQTLSEGGDAGSNSLTNLGQLTIGSATPAADAALDINSTTGALVLPRMTTAQRDALTPAAGMMIYNTDVEKFQGYAYGVRNIIVQTDTSSHASYRSVLAGYWITYQSFTAPTTTKINSITILTDASSDYNGKISILEGDGTGGTVLYSESIVYTGCSTGNCESTFDLAALFSVVSGEKYTLKFELTSGSLSILGSPVNPYSGGQVYQNSTSYNNEDIYFIIKGGSYCWVDLH